MLIEVAAALTLSCVAFVSTNLDNLLVLTALRAAGSPRRMVAGYAAAVVLVMAVGAGFGFADDWLAPGQVGWVGWVPLALGGYQLAVFLAGRATGTRRRGQVAGAAGAFVVFAAMSTDSIAVLGPLVADTANHLESLVLAGWAGMAVVWIWLSGRLASRPSVAAATERLGGWLAPVLMILVGCYILLDTVSDVVT